MTKVLQIVVAQNCAKNENKQIGMTGPERRAGNLITYWKGRGITPVVCYPKRGNLRKVFLDAGVKVIDFEIGDKFNVLAPLRIKKLIKENNIEVVHTQGPASLDLFAVIGGHLARVPVVLTRPVMIEDQVHYSKFRRSIYSLVDRNITLKLAKQIVAVSKAGKDHMIEKCNVNEVRLQLIHNGVDIKRFSKRVSTKHTDETCDQIVEIGMVGHLTAFKGWCDYVEVIDRIIKQEHNIRAYIVGEGDMKIELQQEVKKRGIESHFVFTGYRENIAKLYKENIDIFLFTTHREGLSVAVIEALATGLPLVCTNVGGINEQIDQYENGFVVGVSDFDQMVEYCLKLIRNPSLRKVMGEKSRKIAEDRFSEERMLSEYEQCYKSVADANY